MADILRDIFDKSKNQDKVNFQQGKPILNYELNLVEDILLNKFKNLTEKTIGTNTRGDEFKVLPSHLPNEIKVKKGVFFHKGKQIELVEDYTIPNLTTPGYNPISYGLNIPYDNKLPVEPKSIIIDRERVIVFYKNDEEKGTFVIGSVTGESIFFGSPTLFTESTINEISATIDNINHKIVISYINSLNEAKLLFGHIVEDSITFEGSEIAIATNVTSISSCFDTYNNKLVITYNSSSTGLLKLGTFTSGSYTLTSPITLSANNLSFINCEYCTYSKKILFAYKSSNSGKAKVGTISGSSITFGTESTFETSDISDIHTCYYPEKNKFLIAYKNLSNNLGTIVSGAIITNIVDENVSNQVDGSNKVFKIAFPSIIEPLHGLISDNISNAIVKVNGTPVTIDTVNGLEGVITLISTPALSTNVRVTYNTNTGTYITNNATLSFFGAKATFSTQEVLGISVSYDTFHNKVIVNFKELSSTPRVKGIVGTVNTNDTIVFGEANPYKDDSDFFISGYDDLNKKVILISDDTATVSSPTIRKDTVFVEWYLEEINASKDPSIKDPYLGFETTTQNRIKFFIKVAENSPYPKALFNPGDNYQLNNIFSENTSKLNRNYFQIATLLRNDTPIIENEQIIDDRNKTLNNYVVNGCEVIKIHDESILFDSSVVSIDPLNTITFFNHTFTNRQRVRFETTENLPIGLVTTVIYYIIVIDSNTIAVSATDGGSPVVLTSQGTGTHKIVLLNNFNFKITEGIAYVGNQEAVIEPDSPSMKAIPGDSGYVYIDIFGKPQYSSILPTFYNVPLARITSNDLDLIIEDLRVYRPICWNNPYNNTTESSEVNFPSVTEKFRTSENIFKNDLVNVNCFKFSTYDIKVDTDIITIPNHKFETGTPLKFSSLGTLPEVLDTRSLYYCVVKDKDNFQITNRKIEFYPYSIITVNEPNGNTITIENHGLVNNEPLKLFSNGRLPDGLDISRDYFAIVINKDTIKVTETSFGPEVDITSQGTGNHYLLHDFVNFSESFIDFSPESIYLNNYLSIIAGSFVIGTTYVITSIGTTDFIGIGAPSNTVGIPFVATGIGSGTGTAAVSGTPINVLNIQNHGFSNDDKVKFDSTGSLPVGIEKNIIYFIKVIDVNNFRISLYSEDVLIANPTLPQNVIISAKGSGIHTIYGPLDYNSDKQLSFTDQDIDVVNDALIIPNHGFITNDLIQLIQSEGTLPNNLYEDIVYYVYKVDNNTIKLSRSYITGTPSFEAIISAPTIPGTFYAKGPLVDVKEQGIGYHFVTDNTIKRASAKEFSPAIGIAPKDISKGEIDDIVVLGKFQNTLWDLIQGRDVYSHTEEGLITQNPNNVTGYYVQKIGTSLTKDTILFNPDLTIIKNSVAEVNLLVKRDSGDIEVINNFDKFRTYRLSNLAPEPQLLPNQTFNILSGYYYFDENQVKYFSGITINLGPDGYNYKTDETGDSNKYKLKALSLNNYCKVLVTLNKEGNVKIYESDPNTNYSLIVAPECPANELPICIVRIKDNGRQEQGSIEAITQDDITDLRPWLTLGSMDTSAFKPYYRDESSYIIQRGAAWLNNHYVSLVYDFLKVHPTSLNDDTKTYYVYINLEKASQDYKNSTTGQIYIDPTSTFNTDFIEVRTESPDDIRFGDLPYSAATVLDDIHNYTNLMSLDLHNFVPICSYMVTSLGKIVKSTFNAYDSKYWSYRDEPETIKRYVVGSGETLSKFDLVYISGSTISPTNPTVQMGVVSKASASATFSTGTILGKLPVMAITIQKTLTENQIDFFKTYGYITNPDWEIANTDLGYPLTPGKPVYLTDSSNPSYVGKITSIKPTKNGSWTQEIGVVITPNTILFNPKEAIINQLETKDTYAFKPIYKSPTQFDIFPGEAWFNMHYVKLDSSIQVLHNSGTDGFGIFYIYIDLSATTTTTDSNGFTYQQVTPASIIKTYLTPDEISLRSNLISIDLHNYIPLGKYNFVTSPDRIDQETFKAFESKFWTYRDVPDTIRKFEYGETSISEYDLVYLNDSNTVKRAVASVGDNITVLPPDNFISPAIAICMKSALKPDLSPNLSPLDNNQSYFKTYGYITDQRTTGAWNWIPGKPLYLHPTEKGKMTQTDPKDTTFWVSGTFLQQVGIALTEKTILFSPELYRQDILQNPLRNKDDISFKPVWKDSTHFVIKSGSAWFNNYYLTTPEDIVISTSSISASGSYYIFLDLAIAKTIPDTIDDSCILFTQDSPNNFNTNSEVDLRGKIPLGYFDTDYTGAMVQGYFKEYKTRFWQYRDIAYEERQKFVVPIGLSWTSFVLTNFTFQSFDKLGMTINGIAQYEEDGDFIKVAPDTVITDHIVKEKAQVVIWKK